MKQPLESINKNERILLAQEVRDRSSPTVYMRELEIKFIDRALQALGTDNPNKHQAVLLMSL
jgi:hypothetical protein